MPTMHPTFLWAVDEHYHKLSRPSHLKIPDRPRMARAALSMRAIEGPCAAVVCGNVAVKQGDACLIFGDEAGHLWPVQNPARRAI